MKTDKQHIGVDGERYVERKYLRKNLDVINTNSCVMNSAYYDICCINTELGDEPVVKCIQVKTTNTLNVHSITAFKWKDVIDKDFLKKNIKGPWIFLFGNGEEEFNAYILTRRQTINFLYNTSKWYLNWDRKKPVNLSNPGTFEEKWFNGTPYKQGERKNTSCPFALPETFENWDNIWND